MQEDLLNCAYCGEPLKGRRYFRHHFFVDGSPSVAWHTGCESKDPITPGLDESTHETVTPLLREIENRGNGRLVANERWQEVASDV